MTNHTLKFIRILAILPFGIATWWNYRSGGGKMKWVRAATVFWIAGFILSFLPPTEG